MTPNLPVLAFLVKLRTLTIFTREDARLLWNGDTAFQCVWTYLNKQGRIVPVSRGPKYRGYSWRVNS